MTHSFNLSELKRLAFSEPEPRLRKQYAEEYAQALEALAKSAVPAPVRAPFARRTTRLARPARIGKGDEGGLRIKAGSLRVVETVHGYALYGSDSATGEETFIHELGDGSDGEFDDYNPNTDSDLPEAYDFELVEAKSAPAPFRKGRVVSTELFTFDELSDSAKKKAREWWKTDEDSVVNDFVDEDLRAWMQEKYPYISSPKFYWSVGYVQGDYGKLESGILDIDAFCKANGIDMAGEQNANDGLTFRIQRGDLDTDGLYQDFSETVATKIEEAFTSLSKSINGQGEIYRVARENVDGQLSDESVDDALVSNGYEFHSDGTRADDSKFAAAQPQMRKFASTQRTAKRQPTYQKVYRLKDKYGNPKTFTVTTPFDKDDNTYNVVFKLKEYQPPNKVVRNVLGVVDSDLQGVVNEEVTALKAEVENGDWTTSAEEEAADMEAGAKSPFGKSTTTMRVFRAGNGRLVREVVKTARTPFRKADAKFNSRTRADQTVPGFAGPVTLKFVGKCPISGYTLYDDGENDGRGVAGPNHTVAYLDASEMGMSGPDVAFAWSTLNDGQTYNKAVEYAKRQWTAKTARAPFRKGQRLAGGALVSKAEAVITEGQPGKRKGKSDYRLVERLSDDEVVLDEGNGPELYVYSPHHAGFAVVVDGKEYEFVSEYKKSSRAPFRKGQRLAGGRLVNKADEPVATRVTFRYPKDEKFSDQPDAFLWDVDVNSGRVAVYTHIGQHSEADLGYYASETKPASLNDEAVQDLKSELEGIGYKLQVVAREPSDWKDEAWASSRKSARAPFRKHEQRVPFPKVRKADEGENDYTGDSDEVIDQFGNDEQNAVHERGYMEVTFKDGQTWLACGKCGSKWKVDDSFGYQFERTSTGDKSCEDRDYDEMGEDRINYLVEAAFREGNDKETGGVEDEHGLYEMITSPIDGLDSKYVAFIRHEDNEGFKDYELFEARAEAEERWAEIEAEQAEQG